MNKFFLIPTLFFISIVIFVSCVFPTNYNSEIDQCLDAGGCWLQETKTCEMRDQQKCKEEAGR
jgi:hypothetical protein